MVFVTHLCPAVAQLRLFQSLLHDVVDTTEALRAAMVHKNEH
jgi:hypothetical protein